jgi:hypothetical protein
LIKKTLELEKNVMLVRNSSALNALFKGMYEKDKLIPTNIDLWIVGDWDFSTLENSVSMLLQHAYIFQQQTGKNTTLRVRCSGLYPPPSPLPVLLGFAVVLEVETNVRVIQPHASRVPPPLSSAPPLSLLQILPSISPHHLKVIQILQLPFFSHGAFDDNEVADFVKTEMEKLHKGTVRISRQKFTLEDAIGSHTSSLEASRRVANGIPLGWSLLLPVDTVNCVQTLKVLMI